MNIRYSTTSICTLYETCLNMPFEPHEKSTYLLLSVYISVHCKKNIERI